MPASLQEGTVSGQAGVPERISIVINSQGTRFPQGLHENNNPYLKYIEGNTGLDVQVILPPQEGYQHTVEAMLNNEQVPDMLSVTSDVWIARQVQRGALQPLDELLQQYGPDLLRQIPQEAWDRVRFQGKIYGIPSMNSIPGVELMYVRKDWLNRLGLKAPRTLEEYREVMRAFTQEDPDGNGKHDTYGLAMTNHLYRSAPFFGAFGVQLNQWTERQGQLVYSNILPETKEALLFLASLYREGWIDPEFPLMNHKNLEEGVEQGRVGLFSAAWHDTRGMIARSRELDPKAEWMPLEYPTGPKGDHGVYAAPSVKSYQVIPAKSAGAGAVVRLLNFIGGPGYETLSLGFPNEVWVRKEGRIVSNFAEHDKHQYRGIYGSLAEVADPELLRDRLDSYGEEFRLYDNLQRIERNLIRDAYTGAPTESMELYSESLLALQRVFIQIIMGTVPPEAFDAYVREWKQGGGDAITEEVNRQLLSSRK
ncbi:Peripheral protein [Paenibacillus mucilaginosus 3016]|uniref:Peripheral protein n=2 Tax=Paenibacillus mucilaginosus TaxID=61624 RepID=H6NNM2_9BACL|nr:Peripheral protein [Paenibacillus mucilaginosus 3016]